MKYSDYIRCACGECIAMPTATECRCCTEYAQYRNKLAELPEPTQDTERIQCITKHPGFEPVCLNMWVLQAAFYTFRQRYGNIQATQNELVTYKGL